MKANAAERAMQEKASARQREKQKKRIDILTAMLYKNNKCNQELGKQVENGKLQFFDCPPILYSPVSDKNKQKEQQEGPSLPK